MYLLFILKLIFYIHVHYVIISSLILLHKMKIDYLVKDLSLYEYNIS
jgi:hypothetical protein